MRAAAAKAQRCNRRCAPRLQGLDAHAQRGPAAMRRYQPKSAAAARGHHRRESCTAAVHGVAPLHLPGLSRERAAAARRRTGAAAGARHSAGTTAEAAAVRARRQRTRW
jgi:hypothetical protein